MPDPVLAPMTRTEQSGLIVLLVGFAVFFFQGGEVLAKHSEWGYFQTPPGVGELFTVFGGVVAAIIGALLTDAEKILALFKPSRISPRG